MDRFKYFLINESKSYLGHRVNDVLTAIQDVQNDMQNLGTRHLTRLAENIVNEIRKILHGQWEVQHQKHLRQLQKVAVAIMRTIDEKGDLREVLPAAAQSLQNVAGQLGVKTNNLQAPEMPGEPVSQADFEETGDGTSQPPMSQQAPQGPPMQTPMAQSGTMGGASPAMGM